jgi:hypothetical protein
MHNWENLAENHHRLPKLSHFLASSLLLASVKNFVLFYFSKVIE